MTGLELKGLVTVKDGIAYIDQNPLVQALEQFNGRYVELKFQFPEDVKWEMDEGIKPLVTALQGIGLTTLSSCEGSEEYPYSYVSLIRDNAGKYMTEYWQQTLLEFGKKRGWSLAHYSGKVWQLRANVKKTREEILEFANKIRKTFSVTAR
jgi:hypothetical protein